MKKKGSLFSFIMVVAALAAAAALIVTNIDKICEFLEVCKKAVEDSCRSGRSCCDECPPPEETESDFEDVEL